MTLQWKTIAQWLKIVGAFIAVVTAMVGWSLFLAEKGTNAALVSTQQRRSPVTEYNTAHFEQQDCVQSYTTLSTTQDVTFKADIAEALTLDRTDTTAVANITKALSDDHDKLLLLLGELRTLDKLCPAPEAPVFDEHGTLVRDTVVFPQTPAPHR